MSECFRMPEIIPSLTAAEKAEAWEKIREVAENLKSPEEVWQQIIEGAEDLVDLRNEAVASELVEISIDRSDLLSVIGATDLAAKLTVARVENPAGGTQTTLISYVPETRIADKRYRLPIREISFTMPEDPPPDAPRSLRRTNGLGDDETMYEDVLTPDMLRAIKKDLKTAYQSSLNNMASDTHILIRRRTG